MFIGNIVKSVQILKRRREFRSQRKEFDQESVNQLQPQSLVPYVQIHHNASVDSKVSARATLAVDGDLLNKTKRGKEMSSLR
jgi:hypothetical protein